MKNYSEIIGTPVFIDVDFFQDHEDLLLWIEEQYNPEQLNEDFKLEVTSTNLEPIVQLKISELSEFLYDINEERYSENGVDDEVEKIKKHLLASIDFDKINKSMPSLYYGTNEKHLVVWDDIKDHFSSTSKV